MANVYNVKTVLLGEPAVGKTSIRRRYMGEGFKASHLSTLGADFAQKTISVDEHNTVKMQIWDIAGHHQFKQIRTKFLLNANACLMVFDLTRKDTFLQISKWLQDFWEINPEGDIPLLIIGNKADLTDQIKVDQEDLDQLVNRLENQTTPTARHVTTIITSAATGFNIEAAFLRVSRQISDIYAHLYK